MNAPVTPPTMPPYHHTPLFPLGPDKTPYRKLDVGGVKVENVMGKDMLVIEHEALRALSEAAFTGHQPSVASGASQAAAQDPRRSGGER